MRRFRSSALRAPLAERRSPRVELLALVEVATAAPRHHLVREPLLGGADVAFEQLRPRWVELGQQAGRRPRRNGTRHGPVGASRAGVCQAPACRSPSCRAPMEVHLVDGTYELFRHHFAVPSHLDPDGIEVAAVRGVLGSMLGDARAGRDPRRRGHRPGRRVVPQRPLDRVQDERGHGARAARPSSRCSRTPSRARRRRVADGRARGRRRAWRPPRRVAREDPRVERVVHLHSRQGPRAVRRGPGGRAARPPPGAGDRRGRRAGEVRRGPRRSPTTSRWSATPPTASPACPAGARSRPRWCSPGTSTSTPIPDDVADWDVRSAARPSWRRRSPARATRAALFLDLATLRTDADVGDVDDWEWRGPRARARRLGRAARRRRIRRRARDRLATRSAAEGNTAWSISS